MHSAAGDHRRPTPVEAGRDVTALVLELREGDRDALDRLFPIIYGELHRIAHAQLVRERDGHTLSPTALVHEAYFKLVDVTRVEWRDRSHFPVDGRARDAAYSHRPRVAARPSQLTQR